MYRCVQKCRRVGGGGVQYKFSILYIHNAQDLGGGGGSCTYGDSRDGLFVSDLSCTLIRGGPSMYTKVGGVPKGVWPMILSICVHTRATV